MYQSIFSIPNLIAQVNFGTNSAFILGIFVYFGGALLCSLALFKPHLARYHDILLAQFGWICGGILIFLGWRLDPILQFGQLLLVGTATFFVIDAIRQRRIR
ncbi:Ycf66 family protein [Anabaena sp. UHCC 0399]|uniref:Ycf66 family protein n=1 Tax=Anabaena sp. UHCC 0399 TaxID=3110238 RepID=UPI002B208AC0|nr:Ycf66 family protein [Anabaena sp. UHCC 0399]MEA5566908.1 Ycf66 family protein [Anabaena sp. UHCC 0399]